MFTDYNSPEGVRFSNLCPKLPQLTKTLVLEQGIAAALRLSDNLGEAAEMKPPVIITA